MPITAIIIIGLAIAMMLGPIMMMQPSRYQRQLANLRGKALSLGLRVRLQTYNNQTVSVYQKPWPINDGRKWEGDASSHGISNAAGAGSREWRLEKQAFAHEIHFWGLWDWSDGIQASSDCFNIIQPVLTEMPKGVNVVSVTKLGVECYWDERGGELVLAQVEQQLGRLSSMLWPHCSR